ncbi:hypothetical protein GGE06_008135 [Streptomyces sp. SFB5A]|uniref:Transposase n=1 Tax=Streptomyces nymphaeiformis TaxID=2663842 RepID=A0A7W7U963_9ACTN|nr:hypothetical protein [Streptomyces nymphaeiformis]
MPLTSRNRHDVTQLMPLLDAIPHIRRRHSRPRHRPGRPFADRGYDYDYDKYRRPLRARDITPKIARKDTAPGARTSVQYCRDSGRTVRAEVKLWGEAAASVLRALVEGEQGQVSALALVDP